MVATARKNNRPADREPFCLSWPSSRLGTHEENGMHQSQISGPSLWSRRRPRHTMQRVYSSYGLTLCLLFLLLSFLTSTAEAVFINFDNCLEDSILDDSSQLQFVPLFFSVVYDSSPGPNPLNITVYGNITGVASGDTEPAAGSPEWDDPKSTAGKIVDVINNDGNLTFTTLFTTLDLLSYSPYDEPTEFCPTVHGGCPMSPVFNANASDPNALRSFTVSHNIESSYQFTSLASTLRVKSGDTQGTDLACISAVITPELGSSLRNSLSFIPLVVLIFVAIANILGSVYSPWGSTDMFRWTSNYGRDEDLLRLVTPGFADCLQYIQFIALTGALSLNYPGFFQPIVSRGAWSALMFNESFVSDNPGTVPVLDGVYFVNSTYGMDRFGQYIGFAADKDIWPGSMVWLLVIIGGVTVLTQLAFGFRWIYHKLADVPEEDLRAKNIPFTIGNVIRITFNFFLLPILSLALFQLVIAAKSPAYSVALAVVLILVLLCFAFWMIRLIITTRPRAYLFDDLSTVLLYGPLYNTYCDDAAPFAVVPIFITFVRAIAIGALQPSGIAQVVLLAVCEVAFVLVLVAFRPYPSPTSMNLYQFVFALVRFLVAILSITFVPALGISEQTKGWIGYVILVLHGGMLVFGFFLNALQTLIEVFARLAGAGGVEGGATRGGLTKVFGARQLSRRNPRSSTRQSMASDAAMLANMDERSTPFGESRARSLSGSSAFLLRNQVSDGRVSTAYDAGSAHGGTHSRAGSSGMYTPTTPGASSAFSHPAGYQPMTMPKMASFLGLKPEAIDPYYRPPRPKSKAPETPVSGAGERTQNSSESDTEDNAGDQEHAGHAVPAAYLGAARDEPDLEDSRPNRKDYAVREVDFYYRVRGPALSHKGTRKLKTGPADPTGPVSSASGWFRRFMGGKTKEPSKGFEVVRSSRAPPAGLFPPAEDEEYHEPYRDEPDAQNPNKDGAGSHSRNVSGATASSNNDSDQAEGHGREEKTKDSFQLPQVDAGGSIELPSRVGSRSSVFTTSSRPPVPRKSSRRQTQMDGLDGVDPGLVAIPGSPEPIAGEATNHPMSSEMLQPSESQARLPFAASDSGSKHSHGDRSGSVASTSSTIQRTASAEPGRPSGMGYVVQHRAGASIHQPGSENTIAGSAAELVEQNADSESK
ncbi:putative membrane protein C1322,03 [Talaromyces islandicus]|uniref:Putative membrane protein C1322,03 n=1 Tax=Talaromyces islandicus TaxID=28573 RepID=A0A0U1M7R9_TALIS|nr:putative membrane protein C1322,03 [Talaromyces islandicus]